MLARCIMPSSRVATPTDIFLFNNRGASRLGLFDGAHTACRPADANARVEMTREEARAEGLPLCCNDHGRSAILELERCGEVGRQPGADATCLDGETAHGAESQCLFSGRAESGRDRTS
jgi:hypothetical protein